MTFFDDDCPINSHQTIKWFMVDNRLIYDVLHFKKITTPLAKK